MLSRASNELFTESSYVWKHTGLFNKIIQISMLMRSGFAMAVDDLVEVQGLESLAANRRKQIELRCAINKVAKRL